MFANMYATMIKDGMDPARTMLPHFFYVCKYVGIYNNRWDGPSTDYAAIFLLSANMYAFMIIDGIDPAKTMLQHLYYVCK